MGAEEEDLEGERWTQRSKRQESGRRHGVCWAARRAWGHQADLGDQLHQPALLWDRGRLARAGPRVPEQVTSVLGCMCVNLVKSVSQSTLTGGGGVGLPSACSSCQLGGVVLGFLQTTGVLWGRSELGVGRLHEPVAS